MVTRHASFMNIFSVNNLSFCCGVLIVNKSYERQCVRQWMREDV